MMGGEIDSIVGSLGDSISSLLPSVAEEGMSTDSSTHLTHSHDQTLLTKPSRSSPKQRPGVLSLVRIGLALGPVHPELGHLVLVVHKGKGNDIVVLDP